MYKTISKAVVNHSLVAQQQEHSNRRKVYILSDEYIVGELGITNTDITPEQAEYIENELQIRQVLASTTIVKAMDYDFRTDSLRLYTIDPQFNPVAPGEYAPEQIIAPT